MGVLGDHDSGERRADHRVGHLGPAQRDLPLPDGNLLLHAGVAGAQRVELGAVVVVVGLTDDSVGQQLRRPPQRQLGQLDLDPCLLDVTLGPGQPRFGELERRTIQLVVEAGHDLALRDRHPFFDTQLHQPARNLGSDRRAPTGGDVAGGIQHGGSRRPALLAHREHPNLDGAGGPPVERRRDDGPQ